MLIVQWEIYAGLKPDFGYTAGPYVTKTTKISIPIKIFQNLKYCTAGGLSPLPSPVIFPFGVSTFHSRHIRPLLYPKRCKNPDHAQITNQFFPASLKPTPASL